MRVLYEESFNKRKAKDKDDNRKAALDHYFKFISATLDVLNHHEQLKGHYMIINDVSIHNSDQIVKLNCKSWIWIRISSTIISRA